MQNVARAQRVHSVDPSYLNLKSMSAIPSQDWLGTAGDCDVRHTPFREPGDGRVRIGRPARNQKSLAADSGGEQRRNLFSSRLPASSIQNQHCSGLAAGGEYRHGLVEMETIAECHGRNLPRSRVPRRAPVQFNGESRRIHDGAAGPNCIEKHCRQGCLVRGAGCQIYQVDPEPVRVPRERTRPMDLPPRRSSAPASPPRRAWVMAALTAGPPGATRISRAKTLVSGAGNWSSE